MAKGLARRRAAIPSKRADPADLPRNATVASRDPRIKYRGTWTDQAGGEHQFATEPDAGFLFSFNGTAIYYHATINPLAAILTAVIDNGPPDQIDGSKTAVKNASPIKAVIYSKTGLDPSKEHLLNVSWYALGAFGGPYGELYSLEYTQNNARDTTTTPQSPASSKSNKSAIIGGAVGGVAGGIIIAVLLFFLLRRGEKPAQTNGTARQSTSHRRHSISPYPVSEIPSVTELATPSTATPLISGTLPTGRTKRSEAQRQAETSRDSPSSPGFGFGGVSTTLTSGGQVSLGNGSGTVTERESRVTPSSNAVSLFVDDPPPQYEGRRSEGRQR